MLPPMVPMLRTCTSPMFDAVSASSGHLPRSSGDDVQLEWGVSLREFHPRMTTVDQVDSVTVRGWNPDERQDIVGRAQSGSGAPQVGESRPGGDVAQGAFNMQAEALVTNRPVRQQAVADQIARAVADRRAQRFIEAEGTCAGNPGIGIYNGAARVVQVIDTGAAGPRPRGRPVTIPPLFLFLGLMLLLNFLRRLNRIASYSSSGYSTHYRRGGDALTGFFLGSILGGGWRRSGWGGGGFGGGGFGGGGFGGGGGRSGGGGASGSW